MEELERLGLSLLTLEMEKGAMSQEMQQLVEAGKGKETDPPLERLERNAALPIP